MSPPEGVKKLYLAVLSTGECVFPRLGEAAPYTPVHGAAVGHGTEYRGLVGYSVTCQVHSSATSVSPAEVWVVTFGTSLSRGRGFQ